MAARAPVVEIAHAKVNLALHVLGRRIDGYHELDSIVAFADLGDRLRFAPARRFSLELTGPFAADLVAGGDNLVMRAADALARRLPGAVSPAHITLEKNLPVASGLGGGSADAAASLRGLVQLSGLAPSPAVLAEVALSLGADVPACLASRATRMTGIGERLAPLPGFKAVAAVLVNPGQPIETVAVFRALALETGARLGEPIADTDDLTACRNDLTMPAIRIVPAIADVLAEIAASEGVRLVRMSGSGATGFGLFASCEFARDAARRIGARHPEWWCVATILS